MFVTLFAAWDCFDLVTVYFVCIVLIVSLLDCVLFCIYVLWFVCLGVIVVVLVFLCLVVSSLGLLCLCWLCLIAWLLMFGLLAIFCAFGCLLFFDLAVVDGLIVAGYLRFDCLLIDSFICLLFDCFGNLLGG